MAKVAVEGQRRDKLKHVKLSDITVAEDRAREDFGDIEELVNSIKDKGIIQPITLDGSLNLLAGGRRYRAATLCELDTIPCIIRDDVSELDAKEIELIENVHRKDFTWQERARLTAEIDTLYKKKDPNWSQRKTVELLDSSLGRVNREIQLAKAMEVIPEIADAKTADDAFKMIKKLEEQAITAELRRRQQSHVDNSDRGGVAPGVDSGIAAALKNADQNYIIKDVFKGMEGLRSNGNISIIECDPPYGIDLNNQKASADSVGSTVEGYKEVHSDVYVEFLNKLTAELFRVAGKDCWLVFWFGQSWGREVYDSLVSAGWKVDEIPSIWVKPNGQTLQPELYYARCYEPFYLCRKGRPVLAKRGRSNVFDFSGDSSKYHPTQRPVPLIEEILGTLSVGMDTVFVPFLGSGATLRACYNGGLKGFGFDLDGKYKDKFMLAVEEDTRKLFKE
jgi:ParB/RepB/Spo0J family partition protein